MSDYACLDCRQDTRDEWYMVHDSVWGDAGMDLDGGFLCIGCLEDRLGRELGPIDFAPLPINSPAWNLYGSSQRLLRRLGL